MGAWDSYIYTTTDKIGLPRQHSGKECTCQPRRCRRLRFDPWVGKIPWRRTWQPTPVFLPGELHGWRSLVGYSPWGPQELDPMEQLSMQHMYKIDDESLLESPRSSA